MARSSRRAAANKRTLRVDFTNAGQTRFTPPEDDYLVEIVKVNKGESSSGNDQLEMDFKVLDGKHKDKQFRQWFSLVDQALWKLAGVLRSAGVDIPEEVVDLDLDDIEGRKLQVTIEHREYNGDVKADIRDSASLEEVEEGDDDEDEKPKGKKSSKRDDDDEDEKPARRSRSSKKDDDDEEEEKPKSKSRRRDDDDEEEEAPKSKKKSKKLPALSGDEVSDMDEEGLEDVIEQYGLDVDLSSYKTLRKKAAAVIDALETAGHLEEE
ncbi:MAG: hypothetical protein CGW95_01070 [Phenylobacterium zucineum]|nr:MAG: hypothetical protein CGW95_01070 [Phenylobacterium zucineum]